MTQARPFTMIAAIIFGAMALGHLYRLATHFQIVAGSHVIPMSISWIAIIVTALLSVMLFRESRR